MNYRLLLLTDLSLTHRLYYPLIRRAYAMNLEESKNLRLLF